MKKTNRKTKKTVRKKASARPPVKRAKIKKMAARELKLFKALLLKERQKVGGSLNYITETSLKKSQRDASGDLSGYSYHMADMASDDYERDFSLGRATDEQRILFSIDEALKRIEEGVYGNCPQCGKSIPKRRLKALPYTELCIVCQKANEVK